MEDWIFILVLMGVVGIRVLLHFVDKGRIVSAAEHKGWRDVVVSWCPFAPVRLSGKGRHYMVRYRDEEGIHNERMSLLMGLFWRDETSQTGCPTKQ